MNQQPSVCVTEGESSLLHKEGMSRMKAMGTERQSHVLWWGRVLVVGSGKVGVVGAGVWWGAQRGGPSRPACMVAWWEGCRARVKRRLVRWKNAWVAPG